MLFAPPARVDRWWALVALATAERELGLVAVDWRPVYYVCDSYTYFGIMGRKSYGLRASMFSSGDVLGG